jgi:hypothetical protein
MAMHAVIIGPMTAMSIPAGRIIIRIVAVATSAMFMHIDAQRPMPSPASASAHIVAAIAAAEHASMHSMLMAMSMPFISGIDIDFIMSAIMLTSSATFRLEPADPGDATPGPTRAPGLSRPHARRQDRVIASAQMSSAGC